MKCLWCTIYWLTQVLPTGMMATRHKRTKHNLCFTQNTLGKLRGLVQEEPFLILHSFSAATLAFYQTSGPWRSKYKFVHKFAPKFGFLGNSLIQTNQTKQKFNKLYYLDHDIFCWTFVLFIKLYYLDSTIQVVQSNELLLCLICLG